MLCLSTALASHAQVDNMCLNMQPGATVECGAMPELNGLESYTLQMWLCPSTWTSGAKLLTCGNNLAVALGQEGTVTASLGAQTVDVSSNGLKAGQWAHITLVVDNGQLTALVNGAVATTSTGNFALPADCGNMTIGGGYTGRIDEVRLWSTALDNKHDYYTHTTINKWVPEIDNLVAYYKFDQSLCPDIVDYKALFANSTTNHHAAMPQGATREKVTDNAALPYLLSGAYTSNNRFFDRAVTRDQYLLANDLIILGINSYTDGHLKYITTCDHATLKGCQWLSEYEGRKGVVSLDGNGSITTTADVLKPAINTSGDASYTFETWIYLDEWTEGAYIIRKETEDGEHGFSISLGDEATKQVIVKVNGKKFVNQKKLETGKWVHFAVTVRAGGTTRLTFMFAYDGTEAWSNRDLSDGSTDYTPTGNDDCVAVIGEGLHAKLDETCVWTRNSSIDDIKSHMTSHPMPALGKVQTADLVNKGQAFYTYDDGENPGWDSYSQDQWLKIMKSAYEGYSGYKIRISVSSHTGWQNTISSADRRKIFAQDLAELSKPYDGVELDLEWMDGTQTDLGLLADEIRAALPEGKTFMISCHAYGAYKFPTDKMQYVDGFTFQQYGPQKTFFSYDNFESSAKAFVNYGFPKKKVYLSYSTTTSKAYDSSETAVSPITGFRTLMADGTLDPNDEELDGKAPSGDLHYYFMSPDQVYKRSKYVVDNNLQGIFYWDMGNDVDVSNPYCIARNSSYALNANVDSVVTEVTINHPTAITNVVSGNAFSYDATQRTVTSDDASVTALSLYNASGQLLKSTNGRSLRLEGLSTGTYVVKVERYAQKPISKTIVVK